jgi:DNA-binding Lrp family transcriptional regulator
MNESSNTIQESEKLPILDTKDYAILRELDANFRQSFSKIGKKVGLSKNSVALRFEKIKRYTLHNVTGLNNEIMGYTFVKVYYSFDFYNESIEKAIIEEVKKNKNIRWAERYYGIYDIGIGLMVKNIDEIISQVNSFDERFSQKINKKDIQIVYNQDYFRYNFIHKNPVDWVSKIRYDQKETEIKKLDKKILHYLLYEPRANVVDIAKALGVSPKTVSSRRKDLEKKGVIMGYFMTLDVTKFKNNSFKLLIQLRNPKQTEEFEEYISSLKNIKHTAKMLGPWDYELNFIYPNMTDLQNQIESIREKFPNLIKKIEIISFRKRIANNKRNFFED